VIRLCGNILRLSRPLEVFYLTSQLLSMLEVLLTTEILNGLNWHGLRFCDK